MDLKTGEENIIVHEGGPLRVTQTYARSHRERAVQSGNRTITTDSQGRVSEKRCKRLHQFARRADELGLRPRQVSEKNDKSRNFTRKPLASSKGRATPKGARCAKSPRTVCAGGLQRND